MDGRLVTPVPEEMHGRNSTYTNWSCRCLSCLIAANEHAYAMWQQRLDRRTKVDGVLYAPDAKVHGVYSTYVNWGCRCQPCTVANSSRCKSFREEP